MPPTAIALRFPAFCSNGRVPRVAAAPPRTDYLKAKSDELSGNNQGLAAGCDHFHLSVGQSEREGLLRDLNRIQVVRDVTTTPGGANSTSPSLVLTGFVQL